MSELSAEDELELQSLLKQLLKTISDKISSAPSAECAEEILLHLEETDKNFHNYEFVKYLRQYVESSLGQVVEKETRHLTRADGQHAIGSGHDTLIHAVTRRTRDSAEYRQMTQALKDSMTVVVESLINKLEEDQLRKEKRHQKQQQHTQSDTQYADNCYDSDSSFNQSYTFIRQEQLQVLAENLDISKPTQVRWEALQVLCCAPPSDVLSCESWSALRRTLCAVLGEADADFSDKVLQFFAKSFSSSPLNVTRELYTSLAESVQSSFLSQKLNFPSGSAVIDINTPEISRLLKQIRLMNDFQKEVTTFWIRHPEKYMEDVMESTFSLLTLHHDRGSAGAERVLEPVHLLALLDLKATWFNKWMHAHYSRTVVLRLLERKYKSLLVAALQQCLRYSETHQQPVEETPAGPSTGGGQNTGSPQSSVYSAAQLEYAHFVHSLCMLGKLIIYANGRKLFPVRMKKPKDSVGLTDLLVMLINIMYQHPQTGHSEASHTDALSPGGLVMEVLWRLCERDECAARCLHHTAVIRTLLAPVVALLHPQQDELKPPATTLILVADVLARIANTDKGLTLFLYKKNLLGTRSDRTSAAHVIVPLTLRLLAERPAAPGEPDAARTLCGAFFLVCRQMYNTCEGLQVLRPYRLHHAAAAAWKQASSLSDRVPTPVPGASAGTSTQETHNTLVWEETLLDGLLSFAATPKGLLLLQQTGAINECVRYMFARSTKKLQVSRCEKFGYGVMVTQVAATAPGVVALHTSGFVRALVVELWSVLECSSDDVRVVRPRPTPMDPIDRSCLKSFLSLVNLLSSSQSVWELLGRQPLANRSEYSLREVPTSIPDLIDRIVAVNSDVKIHSLFFYEQSHTFGLRLLSVLCCHLDSFLLLESQYNICSMLLQSQRENQAHSDPGEVIIDGLSVERNHLLVRVGVVGGPSERRLPSRALQEGECPYPWPMFWSYPLPGCYTLDGPEMQHTSQDSEMSTFLMSTTDQDQDLDQDLDSSWMDACRRRYCEALKSRPDRLTGPVLADLLQKVVAHLSGSVASFFSPAQYEAEEKSVKNAVLSSVEQLGINTCLSYGRSLKLLRGGADVAAAASDDLTLLLKHVKTFLSTQRVEASSGLSCQRDGYPGHDWLTSTVFLMMGGDRWRSLAVLLDLSSLLTSAFIWPARIHSSVHFPPKVAECGVLPVYWCTAHYVEMLLKAEVPLVHSAFRMSGFTPSQMCLHWLTQCFWNYLDWPQICCYLSTCVVMGPDYQVYLCVALYRHLQPEVLQRTQAQELQVFLKEEPIRGFRVCDYMEFMVGLEHRYRGVVMADMESIRSPAE